MDRKETYQKRLAGVYSYMDAHQLDGAMFTSYENRRYYCGFTGSNGCLIITRDKVCLVTDKRYTTQAQQQTIGVEVIEHSANRLSLVADTIKKCGIKKMVMESCMTVDEYFPLKEKMGDIDVVFERNISWNNVWSRMQRKLRVRKLQSPQLKQGLISSSRDCHDRKRSCR